MVVVYIKVLHFVSGINSGGVEQFLINYTRLINKNHDVNEKIVYQHQPDESCLNELVESGNECIRIHNKRKNPILNFLDTLKIIKKEKPNIIHAHMSLLNFIPLFCGFICGIKVRISHSHIAHNSINSSIMEKFFKKLTLTFATKLVACGEKAGRYMYGKKNFSVIYNSVDIDKFSFNEEKRNKIRSELQIDKDDILFGNIGRLTKQKNQIFLVNLLNEIKKRDQKLFSKIHLIILGNGELKDSLCKYIEEINLGNKLVLHEAVRNIDEYYDAMDVFLLPSLYEGFPVSLVEAQVSGLTCIVSDTVDSTSKINENVFFNKLSFIDWINIIHEFHYKSRHISVDSFRKFNVNITYEDLYNLYKNELENK